MSEKGKNRLSREFQVNRQMDAIVLGGLAITATIALIIVSLALFCTNG